jgi:hypothetical protein
MKLKIRQPELFYSAEIKQLPSKQIYLFTLKKQSKQFVVPVKILNLVIEQQPESLFSVITNRFIDLDVYYNPIKEQIKNIQESQFQSLKIESDTKLKVDVSDRQEENEEA